MKLWIQLANRVLFKQVMSLFRVFCWNLQGSQMTYTNYLLTGDDGPFQQNYVTTPIYSETGSRNTHLTCRYSSGACVPHV